MELKTQIVLIAVLFVVFAVLSTLATRRGSARLRRRSRRRVPPHALNGGEAGPPLVDDARAEPRRTPSPVVLAIAILAAVAAAVAVLWMSNPA